MKTRIIPFCVLSMLLGTVCIANAADSNTQNTIVKEYLMQDASYSLVGYIRAVAVNHLGEVVNSSSFILLSDGRYMKQIFYLTTDYRILSSVNMVL